MVIKKDISEYVVFCETTIKDAVKFSVEKKARTLFIVDESNVLIGLLSGGDLGKWLATSDITDLSKPVQEIVNRNFIYSEVGDSFQTIKRKFIGKIDSVPILDDKSHLKAIAFNKKHEVKIGEFIISPDSKAFIIAEIGNNHNGNLETAKKLIDKAVWAGADCAKFQMRNLDTLYVNKGDANDASEDLGSQYVLDLLVKYSLSNEDLLKAFDYCKEIGILPLCTPWDLESLSALEDYGMPAYKISSGDMTNTEILDAAAKTHKPMIISTGMSNENEIKTTVHLLQQKAVEYVFLHCNSTYPTPFKDINLNYLDRLKELSEFEVGYSGHERGYHIPIAAVSLGAKVIEKHFTLDKNMEGNDHKVSLLPDEFKAMVDSIRELEQALGDGKTKYISQGELMNRETLAKSIVALKNIEKGTTIQKHMLQIKSPGKGLQPIYMDQLIGTAAKRDIPANDFLYTSDIQGGSYARKNFQFTLKWGIPVRFHDYRKLIQDITPDILEFHLSYKDLEVKLDDYLEVHPDMGLVIHSPELFASDHILDFASDDEVYANNSIKEMQSVIDLTRSLKKFFPSTEKPCIVTNLGGFSPDGFIDKDKRSELYDRVFKNLSKLSVDGVEIIIQTMPPFPWHFGGQRYHNLFMDPDEIVNFCKEKNYRICFDVSHSKLACNYFHWSFDEFIKKVAPYTAHIHLVDAKGVDDEGLQIGEGEIDFRKLGEQLQKYSPNASFIPEIWQGHKNEGTGFWEALWKLENLI